jgi:hypothetical protein
MRSAKVPGIAGISPMEEMYLLSACRFHRIGPRRPPVTILDANKLLYLFIAFIPKPVVLHLFRGFEATTSENVRSRMR